MKRVLCVLGTRPEAVKLAPVIRHLRAAPWAQTTVLATGQHRELLDQTLAIFGLSADIDLGVMQPNQTLAALTARTLTALDSALAEQRPDIVLAQGDTTSVMVCALACFYRSIAFGHVEAGLRTHDFASPFPEEFNRVVAGHIARLHFAPTARARDNLLNDGVAPDRIHLTGNTVIDALLDVAARVDVSKNRGGERLVLVTAHRRENFGAPLASICQALRILHDRLPDLRIVYPVHPNPNIASVVHRELVDLPRVDLIPPVDYEALVRLLQQATLVLTDSGGLQEEAPALGKPVLVLRDTTERPEAVEAGVAVLVGTSKDRIVDTAVALLTDPVAYAAMARGVSPYGDGAAAPRIVASLRDFLYVS